MGHSLCHDPLDIVGIEGGVPALLWAGAIHREELKHTHTHTSHRDLKTRGHHSHLLFPKLGQQMPILPSRLWESYLHIHDAAGLRGCEPEDFESKKETSDAHQHLTVGPSQPKTGVASSVYRPPHKNKLLAIQSAG